MVGVSCSYVEKRMWVCSVLESAVAKAIFAASNSLTCLLLLMIPSLNEINGLPKLTSIDGRFSLDELHKTNRPDPDVKDAGETVDDNDDDDNADDQDDDDAGDEDFSGDGGEEEDPEDDPEANGDRESDDDGADEDDDDDDDDDGADEDDDDDDDGADEDDDDDDDGADEDDEYEDEEDAPQPPSKKRK